MHRLLENYELENTLCDASEVTPICNMSLHIFQLFLFLYSACALQCPSIATESAEYKSTANISQRNIPMKEFLLFSLVSFTFVAKNVHAIKGKKKLVPALFSLSIAFNSYFGKRKRILENFSCVVCLKKVYFRWNCIKSLLCHFVFCVIKCLFNVSEQRLMLNRKVAIIASPFMLPHYWYSPAIFIAFAEQQSSPSLVWPFYVSFVSLQCVNNP